MKSEDTDSTAKLRQIIKNDYGLELSEESLSELADKLRRLTKLIISHRDRVLTSTEYGASPVTRSK